MGNHHEVICPAISRGTKKQKEQWAIRKENHEHERQKGNSNLRHDNKPNFLFKYD
jgi:hypothetical protein